MFPASHFSTSDVLYWSGPLNPDRKVKTLTAQIVFFFHWGMKIKKLEIKVSNTKRGSLYIKTNKKEKKCLVTGGGAQDKNRQHERMK